MSHQKEKRAKLKNTWISNAHHSVLYMYLKTHHSQKTVQGYLGNLTYYGIHINFLRVSPGIATLMPLALIIKANVLFKKYQLHFPKSKSTQIDQYNSGNRQKINYANLEKFVQLNVIHD